ncbi:41602_t:CDS:2 [Gigaspora margarita]|uniref:41602_t:CDS:1 n=1 Tax=Gigaspora margarita TaxID=4874 RepID=A0ABN7VC38_GIGMA|nr:41602_t:CDS:2 [Gigaspora margarita]
MQVDISTYTPQPTTTRFLNPFLNPSIFSGGIISGGMTPTGSPIYNSPNGLDAGGKAAIAFAFLFTATAIIVGVLFYKRNKTGNNNEWRINQFLYVVGDIPSMGISYLYSMGDYMDVSGFVMAFSQYSVSYSMYWGYEAATVTPTPDFDSPLQDEFNKPKIIKIGPVGYGEIDL